MTWLFKDRKSDNFAQRWCRILAEDSEVSITATFYHFTFFVIVVKSYCI